VGFVGLGALDSPREVQLPVILCPVDALGGDLARAFPEHDLVVVRTEGGLALVSTRCTHLGCRLRLVGRELACPCHEGRFDTAGNVLSGPPSRNLDWLVGGVDSSAMLFFIPGARNRWRRPIAI